MAQEGDGVKEREPFFSELAQLRWFVYMLGYVAFLGNENFPLEFALKIFPIWVALGFVAHGAWWWFGRKKA